MLVIYLFSLLLLNNNVVFFFFFFYFSQFPFKVELWHCVMTLMLWERSCVSPCLKHVSKDSACVSSCLLGSFLGMRWSGISGHEDRRLSWWRQSLRQVKTPYFSYSPLTRRTHFGSQSSLCEFFRPKWGTHELMLSASDSEGLDVGGCFDRAASSICRIGGAARGCYSNGGQVKDRLVKWEASSHSF